MENQLIVFWFKRFIQILIIALVGLSIVEYFESGNSKYEVMHVLIWSGIAAIFGNRRARRDVTTWLSILKQYGIV